MPSSHLTFQYQSVQSPSLLRSSTCWCAAPCLTTSNMSSNAVLEFALLFDHILRNTWPVNRLQVSKYSPGQGGNNYNSWAPACLVVLFFSSAPRRPPQLTQTWHNAMFHAWNAQLCGMAFRSCGHAHACANFLRIAVCPLFCKRRVYQLVEIGSVPGIRICSDVWRCVRTCGNRTWLGGFVI